MITDHRLAITIAAGFMAFLFINSTTIIKTNAQQVNCTIEGDSTNNLLTGTSSADTICGRDGDDTIRGREGMDMIFGDNGNDILSGGRGNDDLTGGAGSDQFDCGDGANDTVRDFNQSEGDTIASNCELGGSGGEKDDCDPTIMRCDLLP